MLRVGAEVPCHARFLHPKRAVQTRFGGTDLVHGLIVEGEATRVHEGRAKTMVVLVTEAGTEPVYAMRGRGDQGGEAGHREGRGSGGALLAPATTRQCKGE